MAGERRCTNASDDTSLLAPFREPASMLGVALARAFMTG
jgi:hypothetical protein